MTEPDASISSYRDITGWFNPLDKLMFDCILDAQTGLTGTLVELGTYLGRSAVVIADHRQPGERFVVVDLFGSEADLGDGREDEANRRENQNSYKKTLSQERFEANFRALHPELPEVVQGLSSVIGEHVEPSSARFVHIDASHMYDKVAEDIGNVATLMMPGGVVVMDDFRAPHAPGVAAATWEAVRENGLKPIAISSRKFYGTWGDPEPYRAAIVALASANARLTSVEQPLREHTIVRVWVPRSVRKREAGQARLAAAQAREQAQEERARKDAKARAERAARETAARAAAGPAPSAGASRSRSLARDWTPPAVARWVRRRRAAAR